jgi:multicomponent K+:H+ antiporter subunit F
MSSLSMTTNFATAAILASQFLLLLGMGMAIVRMMRGPRAQDRVLALDALTIDGMLLLLTIGIRTGSLLYVEAGLIIALLGFAATAAFSKFLLRGEVIE